MAHRAGQRAAAARARWPPPRRARAKAARATTPGGPRGLRPAPSVAALGRHAAAGVDRARARPEPVDPLDGRAVRRARRDDPGAAEPGIAAGLRRDRRHRALRDPQHRGGCLSFEPDRGHEPAAGLRRSDRHDRSAAPARRKDPRAPAILRAGHRGPAEPAGRLGARRRDGASGRGAMRLVHEYGPAALMLFAGLLVWEAAVYVFSIQFYLLPAPHVIVQSLGETYPLLVEAGLYTFTEAVIGFALGCGGGILAAMAASRS